MFTNFGAIKRGIQVKVFMGAGWEKGTVIKPASDRCQVQVAKRSTTVYDLRNIKSA
jgi:hypothetical protein